MTVIGDTMRSFAKKASRPQTQALAVGCGDGHLAPGGENRRFGRRLFPTTDGTGLWLNFQTGDCQGLPTELAFYKVA